MPDTLAKLSAEAGQTMAEYAVVLGVITIAVVVTLGLRVLGGGVAGHPYHPQTGGRRLRFGFLCGVSGSRAASPSTLLVWALARRRVSA
jgi:Flp pilus assembly pilin Flp